MLMGHVIHKFVLTMVLQYFAELAERRSHVPCFQVSPTQP